MLNATCTSSFNSLPHIFALKRGQTVFMRVLTCLSGPISDCRLIVYSVLCYFVGNEGPRYSVLTDLRFYPNLPFTAFSMLS